MKTLSRSSRSRSLHMRARMVTPVSTHTIRIQSVLFLGSYNYYRCRFAEEFLNHRADLLGMPWKADSRGLVTDISNLLSTDQMHPKAVEYLKKKGVQLVGAQRFPTRVVESDFHKRDRVVALCECEHRAMIEESFPQYTDQVEFWEIENLDKFSMNQALGLIEERLHKLTSELIDG